MANEPINDNDDFNFDDYVSDETKKELGLPDASAETTPEPAKVEETPAATEDTTGSAPVATKPTEVKEDVTPADPSPDAPIDGAPTRAANEPEWKYNYRVELFEKQQALKSATTDTEKKEIKQQMTEIRRDMADTAKNNEIMDDVDPDKLATAVRQQLAYERQVETMDKAELDFLKRHPNIKADQQAYNAFLDHVASTYVIAGKSYHGITHALESAYEDLYPSTTEQKQAKAETVQKKVDAADFSGSSAPGESLPDETVEGRKLAKDLKQNSGIDWDWAVD